MSSYWAPNHTCSEQLRGTCMQRVPALRRHLCWLIYGGVASVLTTQANTLLGFTTVLSVVNDMYALGAIFVVLAVLP